MSMGTTGGPSRRLPGMNTTWALFLQVFLHKTSLKELGMGDIVLYAQSDNSGPLTFCFSVPSYTYSMVCPYHLMVTTKYAPVFCVRQNKNLTSWILTGSGWIGEPNRSLVCENVIRLCIGSESDTLRRNVGQNMI